MNDPMDLILDAAAFETETKEEIKETVVAKKIEEKEASVVEMLATPAVKVEKKGWKRDATMEDVRAAQENETLVGFEPNADGKTYSILTK